MRITYCIYIVVRASVDMYVRTYIYYAHNVMPFPPDLHYRGWLHRIVHSMYVGLSLSLSLVIQLTACPVS